MRCSKDLDSISLSSSRSSASESSYYSELNVKSKDERHITDTFSHDIDDNIDEDKSNQEDELAYSKSKYEEKDNANDDYHSTKQIDENEDTAKNEELLKKEDLNKEDTKKVRLIDDKSFNNIYTYENGKMMQQCTNYNQCTKYQYTSTECSHFIFYYLFFYELIYR